MAGFRKNLVAMQLYAMQAQAVDHGSRLENEINPPSFLKHGAFPALADTKALGDIESRAKFLADLNAVHSGCRVPNVVKLLPNP